MKLVAPKGAVCWICARTFNLCLLAIRFFFTTGLELVFLYVVVFYFWALLGKDRLILCSVHSIRNSAGLEAMSDHFLGDLCPCRLDPTENNCAFLPARVNSKVCLKEILSLSSFCCSFFITEV